MNTTPVIINIGCGRRRMAGAIGIDQIALPTVDIVADIEKGLPFLADNSVDVVIALRRKSVLALPLLHAQVHPEAGEVRPC